MKGFSIGEILLTIALISILVVASIPGYKQLTSWFEIRSTTQQIANLIERAKTLASAQIEDSDWSVKFEEASLIIFKGSNFNGRDQSFDEEYLFSNNIVFSSTSDPLTFRKFTGFLAGDETVTIELFDLSREIFISKQGAIEY